MHRVVLMLLLSACAGGSSGPGGDNGNDAGSDTGAVSDSGGQVGVPGLGIGVSAGGDHTCVHLDNGDVHCWGRSHVGQLGLSTATNLGDNEEPTGSRVDVGAEVVQVSVGGLHTCALTSEGAVKCWGLADLGALGYGNMEEIGIEDTPASVGEVPLPGIAVEVKAGSKFCRYNCRTSSKPISLGICQRNLCPANSPVASPPTWMVNGGAVVWKNCSA